MSSKSKNFRNGVMPRQAISGIISHRIGFKRHIDKENKTKENNKIMRQNFDSESLLKKLELYYDKGLNVHLEGKKGVGKTAIISAVMNKKCKKWLYFSAATCDPFCDFVGVPKETEDKDGKPTLTFIRPEYMTDDVEAIFLDEYNRAAKKIRNATMELIQFKSINGRKFPNLKCVWIGTNPYNPDDDENEVYDVEPLDPAQADRFQVKITIPYAIDENYFTDKFGQKASNGASEWWWGLPDKIKDMVSPRRLDYAIEMAGWGGDIFDVIPLQANPSKLLGCLKNGGVEKLIRQLFKDKDKKAAEKFLNFENNYQASTHLIIQDQEWASFFMPIIDQERQISLFFSNKEFQKIVFENSLFYKELLELISINKLCGQEILSKVLIENNRLKGVDRELGNTVTGSLEFTDFFKKSKKNILVNSIQ